MTGRLTRAQAVRRVFRLAVRLLLGRLLRLQRDLPAASFGGLLFAPPDAEGPRSSRRTFLYFVPAAMVPLAAFFATQYLAFGQFKPVYEEFGTKSYNYEGSYWNTPLEFDWFNLHPESKAALPVPHDLRPPRGLLALADLPVLDLRLPSGTSAGATGRPLRGVSWVTLILTVGDAGLLHLEPEGAELRRVDAPGSAGCSG